MKKLIRLLTVPTLLSAPIITACDKNDNVVEMTLEEAIKDARKTQSKWIEENKKSLWSLTEIAEVGKSSIVLSNVEKQNYEKVDLENSESSAFFNAYIKATELGTHSTEFVDEGIINKISINSTPNWETVEGVISIWFSHSLSVGPASQPENFNIFTKIKILQIEKTYKIKGDYPSTSNSRNF